MTFWTGVASRPPQSIGQLIAAQRPSLSRRCQSLRRSWVRTIPPATRPPPGSSSPPQSARNFGRLTSSQPRSSSRNASSSGVWEKSIDSVELLGDGDVGQAVPVGALVLAPCLGLRVEGGGRAHEILGRGLCVAE